MPHFNFYSRLLITKFSFKTRAGISPSLFRHRVINVMSAGLLSVGLALAHSAAAQPSGNTYPATIESQSAGQQASIRVLGNRFIDAPPVAAHQSRIVLYRLPDDRAGATSVFVDNRYHDSLVPGAWTQLCYRTGPVELAARQMQAATRPAKDPYDSISVLQLQAGQVHYLRVSSNTNNPILRPVPEAQALQELDNTREQLHTVSRVAQDCIEVMHTPAVLAQTYTLPADTLFAFDRSDRAGMTDAGIHAIDVLLSRMQNDYSRIDRVHLIGHADPLGQPERNERLAIERAQTVRDHIGRTGKLQAPMTAEGRSSREPVVLHCGPVATPQAIACNLPNRRVAVEVTGIRR